MLDIIKTIVSVSIAVLCASHFRIIRPVVIITLKKFGISRAKINLNRESNSGPLALRVNTLVLGHPN